MRQHPAAMAALLATLAAAAYVRGHDLARDSVWHDEAHTALMARSAPLDIIQTAAMEDVHPPLYYLVVHYWTMVAGSDDETQLRLPSAAFGVLSVLAIFLLGRELGGLRVGLWSAMLLAASAFHVQYSREARMYAQFLLFAILSLYTFVRLNRTWPRALAWILATVAMLMTHVVGVFVLAAQHLCWVLLAARSRPRQQGPRVPAPVRWTVINIVLALLLVPWLVMALQQFEQVSDGFWIPRPHLSAPVDILIALSGSTSLALGLVAAAAVGLLRLALRAADGQSGAAAESSLIVLVVGGIVPVAAPWILSYVTEPILLPRIAIASLASLLVLVAFGIDAIKPRWASVAAAAVLIVGQGGEAWSYTQRLTKEDWRSTAAYVAAAAQPGDLLLFHQAHRRKGLDYYLPNPVAAVAGFPARRFRADETLQPDDLDDLQRLVAPHKRVWLVMSNGRDPEHLIDRTLRKTFTLHESKQWRQIHVNVYARSSEERADDGHRTGIAATSGTSRRSPS
jgi:hypothetical protein